MEPKELSLALLQPQVTVVATLGELLATLPRREEEETLLECLKHLHRGLEEFTKELRVTLHCIDDTWRRHIVTNDGDGGVTSLSQALAALRSTPGTTRDRVAMAASEWQRSVSVLVDRWAQVTRKAIELHDTWSRVAVTEAMTARVRELQAQAARDGTALERTGELAQALGGEEGAKVAARAESPLREEAMEAASEATRATMERQRVWAALGLLQCLVAECDEAAAFPRELQRLLRDTETTLEATKEKSPDVPEDSEAACDEAATFRSSLWRVFRHPKATQKETKKKFPDVPEDLVVKVAVAELLWEASARLAKDHLVGIIDDITKFYFTSCPVSPGPCGVAKRCQRAIEDIPRLLQPPERPQSVPKVSPVSREPQELSPALLQPQVTVVATLGELLATLPTREEEEMLLESPKRLHRSLEEFTKELWVALHCIDDTWRRHIVTNDGDGGVTSLSRALAAYKRTRGTTRLHVAMAARKWQGSVAVLVDSWAELAGKAPKLRDALIQVAAEALIAELRERQAKAPRYGTAQEQRVELGQALGGEEGAEVVARTESQVREARLAASEATRATMVRQRLEVTLGPLERLVAACDEATAFPRELQRLLRDIETAMKGTKKKFPNVPEDLVAKVAKAERLWETNVRLAEGHLLGIIDDIIDSCFFGGRADPRSCGVAERCQRAMEDIPRLLRPPEHHQSVPKVSPVSTEPHKLSPALLQPQVTVVATLGELLETLPTREEETLLECPGRLHRGLEEFTKELSDILYYTADTLKRQMVTSDYEDIALSLSQALAAYKSTSRTSRDDVTQAACNWQGLVAELVRSWARLAGKATKLCNTCRDLATRRRQQLEAAQRLLQRLVAACDEATVFPRELQRLFWDIEVTLEETNEESPDVPKDLVAKVAKAERLWKANAYMAQNHLVRTVDQFLDYYSKGGRARPSAREVAKWCQRATEDIPNPLQG